MQQPLISIVLSTLNAMPHLTRAIDTLRRQTYRNFELVVQDGASTDGTFEYLQSIDDLPRIDVQSAPDSGLSQGYNRALQRCHGDLLYFGAADERLFDNSLELAVGWFAHNPDAAVICGGQMLINQDGAEVQRYLAEPFDFLEVVQCHLVPPWSTCVFNGHILSKEDLWSDESMATCADYDLWLRLGSRFEHQILTRPQLFSLALADRTSMSFRPELFKQFCKDKCFALDRWLDSQNGNLLVEPVRRAAKFGIYLWAAEQVLSMEGPSARALELVKEALLIHPRARRARQMLGKFGRFDIDALAVSIQGRHNELDAMLESLRQEKDLSLKAEQVYREEGAIQLRALHCEEHWGSKITDCGAYLRLEGGEQRWGYAARAVLSDEFAPASHTEYFVMIKLQVISGTLGVCVMENEQIVDEQVVSVSIAQGQISSRITNVAAFALILRNASAPKAVVDIYDLCLIARQVSPAAVQDGVGVYRALPK